jgi:hypothetical protein
VPLITGRTIKARIGSPNTKLSKEGGTVITVYADEIWGRTNTWSGHWYGALVGAVFRRWRLRW